MIDKKLVEQRFKKSLKTYKDNAFIQKYTAEKLISLLPRFNYGSILEIGCGAGILTEQIKEKLVFSKFSCIDLVQQAKEHIDKIIPDNIFKAGDIEKIELKEKYDLIISNAALQWCENFEKTIEKLFLSLNKSGVLAVSAFGNNNLKELKTVLNLPDAMKTNIQGIEEEKVFYFNSAVDILKHLKYTGANAVSGYKFTKSSLKSFEEQYRSLYSRESKVYLTYNPLYLVKTSPAG